MYFSIMVFLQKKTSKFITPPKFSGGPNVGRKIFSFFLLDKSGIFVGNPSPSPGVLVGKVVGVVYDVGVE